MGSILSTSPIPSTVTTLSFSTCPTNTRQEMTASPLIKTEQEPHSPLPQLSLLPVKSSSSRITSNNGVAGGQITDTSFPFNLKCIFFIRSPSIFYINAIFRNLIVHKFYSKG